VSFPEDRIGPPVSDPPAPRRPAMIAFPDEGFVALKLPSEMVPSDAAREGSSGVLIRFKSEEGFKAFMVDAMEVATLVWPNIAIEWRKA
jgi:hypothetical protein